MDGWMNGWGVVQLAVGRLVGYREQIQVVASRGGGGGGELEPGTSGLQDQHPKPLCHATSSPS